jgi:hypothetical protein
MSCATLTITPQPANVVTVDCDHIKVVTVGVQGPVGPQGPSGTSTPPYYFSFGDASPVTILSGLPATKVLEVTVVFTTQFNGAPTSLSVGTLVSPTLFVAPNQVDPSIASEFEVTSGLTLAAGNDIRLTLSLGAGCTQGAGWILINKVTP